jgi:uncharacterized membrane protein
VTDDPPRKTDKQRPATLPSSTTTFTAPLPGPAEPLVQRVTDDELKRDLLVEMTGSYSGPLPPPRALAAYGEIDPSLIDRIVTMAEGEQRNRHDIERTGLAIQARGQHYALTIGIVGLVVATLTSFAGHPVTGAVIGTVDLVALVSTFIYGSHLRHRDAAEDSPPGD